MDEQSKSLTRCEFVGLAAGGLFITCWLVLPLIGLVLDTPARVEGVLFNGGLIVSFTTAAILRIYVAIRRVQMRGKLLLNMFIVLGVLYGIFLYNAIQTMRRRATYQPQQTNNAVLEPNSAPSK